MRGQSSPLSWVKAGTEWTQETHRLGLKPQPPHSTCMFLTKTSLAFYVFFLREFCLLPFHSCYCDVLLVVQADLKHTILLFQPPGCLGIHTHTIITNSYKMFIFLWNSIFSSLTKRSNRGIPGRTNQKIKALHLALTEKRKQGAVTAWHSCRH